MLKISIIEGQTQRRMIVEGKLAGPWAAELESACEKAKEELGGRELLVDIKHLTAISQEGERVLLGLMNDGVRLRCCGVFTRLVLKQLTRRASRKQLEAKR